MIRRGLSSEESESRDSRSWRCYSPWVLAGYDWWVHGISNRLFWRCPFSRLVELYDRSCGTHHLEVGVGTGLPLRRSTAVASIQHLALVDANPNCLSKASRRLRYAGAREIRTFVQDVSRDDYDRLTEERFDSVGMTYLLHCLPNSAAKFRALTFAARHLKEDGKLFGATLLGLPAAPDRLTRLIESWYRRRGVFGNQDDDRESIETLLRGAFRQVHVQVLGRALIFTAQGTRN